MKRYFEIYVAGSEGFSVFVSVEAQLPQGFGIGVEQCDTDVALKVLELAALASIIDGGDAKEVSEGAGYVCECEEFEVRDEKVNAI